MQGCRYKTWFCWVAVIQLKTRFSHHTLQRPLLTTCEQSRVREQPDAPTHPTSRSHSPDTLGTRQTGGCWPALQGSQCQRHLQSTGLYVHSQIQECGHEEQETLKTSNKSRLGDTSTHLIGPDHANSTTHQPRCVPQWEREARKGSN